MGLSVSRWIGGVRPGPWWPAGLGLVLLIAWLAWWFWTPDRGLTLRRPGADQPPGAEAPAGGNPVLSGKLVQGSGKPSSLPGAWPGFRGVNRDGLAADAGRLARSWAGTGPRVLWSADLGEGYAGPAVRAGRVYLMDYDQPHKQDALRCLSLDDGQELWRFAYPVSVKRNHGMSRTVPTVTEHRVVAMGPKCHVVCLDALTGQLKWGLDLVREHGAVVPPWYAGQCPLVDGDRVILGVGGPEVLLMAVSLETGEVLWRTPNPDGWKMTHASVMPVLVKGERQYAYCASLGVVGVAAADGTRRWRTTDWKISIATVPSPVPLDAGQLLLSGGYDAGALLLEIVGAGETFEARTVWRVTPDVFGATQQTPVLHQGHIYGVRPEPDSRLVCLGLDGKVVWTSEPAQKFGLGPLLIADGVILVMNDKGQLSMVEATPAKYTLLAQAKVLDGRESWGPMALVGTRLLARDLTRMVCLDLGAH